MRRILLGLAVALLLLPAAGCSETGTVLVTWTFAGAPEVEPSSIAFQCGIHRVDSVRLAWGHITLADGGADAGEDGGADGGEASSADGGVDGGTPIAAEASFSAMVGASCAPSSLKHDLSPGVYDFMLFGVDAMGNEIIVPDRPEVMHTVALGIEITAGHTTELAAPGQPMVLIPAPGCRAGGTCPP